jgi:hypothetical protein
MGKLRETKILLTKGWSPTDALSYACSYNQINFIDYIIDNYTFSEKDMYECLDMCIRYGYVSGVQRLLEKYDIDKIKLHVLARKHKCHALLKILKRDSKYRLQFKKH